MDTSDPILTLIGWFLFLGTFALAISVTIGWLTDRWRASIMSRRVAVPPPAQTGRERYSYAAEQPAEQAGTEGRELFRTLAEQLSALSEDDRLTVYALMIDDDGEYIYADSRIGRMSGGRLEDRIAQVRNVRGAPTSAKPAAYVTPIAGRPTKAAFFETDDGLRYEEPPL